MAHVHASTASRRSDLNLTGLHGMVAQTVDRFGARGRFSPDTSRGGLPKRIGYLGISMGAIEGTVFVADEPRIKDAVFWAGGGDWGKLLTTTSLREINARKEGSERRRTSKRCRRPRRSKK